jgi:hypothetical protein
MGYTNIQADVNFRRQVLNQDGTRYATGPYTSSPDDVFRSFVALTDCVITATSVSGDSLTSQAISAGTVVYGLFTSIVVTSGTAALHLAGPASNPPFTATPWQFIVEQWQLITNTWN